MYLCSSDGVLRKMDDVNDIIWEVGQLGGLSALDISKVPKLLPHTDFTAKYTEVSDPTILETTESDAKVQAQPRNVFGSYSPASL